MSAVRKIEISDNNGIPKFRFDSAGLPERPVIMHQCASCLADSVITNKDAGDLAAWLIGEAVDDAHGRGVIDPPKPWSPSGPDDEAGTGPWPRGRRPAGS